MCLVAPCHIWKRFPAWGISLSPYIFAGIGEEALIGNYESLVLNYGAARLAPSSLSRRDIFDSGNMGEVRVLAPQRCFIRLGGDQAYAVRHWELFFEADPCGI